jgi:hypothetical protein
MNMNYYNTFITVAADCPVETGIIPPDKKDGRTKPSLEYELAAGQPYQYTQEELLFEVYVRHKQIADADLEERRQELWDGFFGKSQACLRASMLPKKYGWGIHFDGAGKLALIPKESEAYQQYIENENGELKVVAAMRSSRGK